MVLFSSGTAAGVPEVKVNPNCLSHWPVARRNVGKACLGTASKMHQAMRYEISNLDISEAALVAAFGPPLDACT